MTRLIARRISALEGGRIATQQRAIFVVRAALPEHRSSHRDWARSLAIRYGLPSECFAIVVAADGTEPDSVLIDARRPGDMSEEQLDLLSNVAEAALSLVSIDANSRVSVYDAPRGLDDLRAGWAAEIDQLACSNSGNRSI